MILVGTKTHLGVSLQVADHLRPEFQKCLLERERRTLPNDGCEVGEGSLEGVVRATRKV